jgi:ABC-2 type transport system permease protein
MAQIIGLIMAGQVIFFAFFTGANAMTSILSEDEDGTLARLFTTPTGRATILAGKFLAVFLVVIVQSLVLVALAGWAFRIDWGQSLTVALVVCGQVVAAGGLGVLLISLVRNRRQTGSVLGGVITGLGMLGGLFTVAAQMPDAFNAINLFTPQGWALKAWKLALAGGSPGEVLPAVAVMLAMGTLFFAVGGLIFRRRFA